jgi:protein SCO1/2
MVILLNTSFSKMKDHKKNIHISPYHCAPPVYSGVLYYLVIIILVIANLPVQSLANDRYSSVGENKHAEVGIDEQLGHYIPLDISFTNEKNEKVKLSELIRRPTIIALVYYHCPGICSPLLEGVADVVDHLDMEPLKDFGVLSISFDDREGPASATRWKKEHLLSMKRKLPEGTWTFLTGDSISIHKLTDAVGFYFKRDTDSSFLHYGSLIIVNDKGMISRYIFGTQFLPFDVKMALIEAQRGESRPTINKILAFCYSYDRIGNKYTLNFTKVAGSIVTLFGIVFFLVLILKGRKKSKEIT